MMRGLVFCLLSVFGFFAMNVVSAKHLTQDVVEKRIAPFGGVYVDGDDVPTAGVKDEASEEVAKVFDVEESFQTYCSGCHASGAMGAPKVGSKKDWKPRMAKGMKKVVAKAMKGFGNMPPKGGCSKCSSDEMRQLVQRMIK